MDVEDKLFPLFVAGSLLPLSVLKQEASIFSHGGQDYMYIQEDFSSLQREAERRSALDRVFVEMNVKTASIDKNSQDKNMLQLRAILKGGASYLNQQN
ncbi:trpB [Acrasis kona]|uniref:TrpB n=1 Tax=Acrasis kona TaxID=1008807 RepID=A0AAW2ZCD5_9EUKA